MPEESMIQKFRSKKIDEIRNYLIEERNRNELMCKKHKKVCRVLNYTDHSLIIIFEKFVDLFLLLIFLLWLVLK